MCYFLEFSRRYTALLESEGFYGRRPASASRFRPIESTSIERPSVIMIGVDSQSRSNFIRQLPQTYELLNRWGFVDMKSHVKVHDNTFVNLLAVLLGKRGTSYKVCS
jgi:hypothetical protein